MRMIPHAASRAGPDTLRFARTRRCAQTNEWVTRKPSPPARGRGSKQLRIASAARRSRGRPPRGGVDRNSIAGALDADASASPPARGRGSKHHVAPTRRRRSRRSPPARGRGSKHADRVDELRWLAVAPRAGAWIETSSDAGVDVDARSRPPRGGVDRNLPMRDRHGRDRRSPPARGRGSKHAAHAARSLRRRVAPRAGAWIETC